MKLEDRVFFGGGILLAGVLLVLAVAIATVKSRERAEMASVERGRKELATVFRERAGGLRVVNFKMVTAMIDVEYRWELEEEPSAIEGLWSGQEAGAYDATKEGPLLMKAPEWWKPEALGPGARRLRAGWADEVWISADGRRALVRVTRT